MAVRKLRLDGRTYEHDRLVGLWKVRAALYTPKAVDALGRRAAEGDVEAARLLLQLARIMN